MTNKDNWVGRAEAAEHYGVSTRTISRWRQLDKVEWRYELIEGQMLPRFNIGTRSVTEEGARTG